MARRAFIFGSNGSPAYGRLKFAERDADTISQTLSQRGCDFAVARPRQIVKPLAVLEELIEAVNQCEEDDVFVCYFSGHGELYRGELFLILDQSMADNHLFNTALQAADVTKHITRCSARNKLLILDCCHAGAAANAKGKKDAPAPAVVPSQLGLDKNHLTLFASGRFESAREFDDLQGSFLTQEMCAILKPIDDSPITVKLVVDELRARAKARNATAAEAVPLPYLFGVIGGDLYLRTRAATEAKLTFSELLQPNISELTNDLWRFREWAPRRLREDLPLLVAFPAELQNYSDAISEYVADRVWPDDTTEQEKTYLTWLSSTTLPEFAKELVGGIGQIVSYAQADFVGNDECLTIAEQDRLLDLFVRAKMLSLVRYVCSKHPRSLAHEEWMTSYFRLESETALSVAAGLPWFVNRPSIQFWVDAELSIEQDRTTLFLPSVVFEGHAQTRLTRGELIEFVLPQVLDEPNAERIVLSLLQTPDLAKIVPHASQIIAPPRFEICRSASRVRRVFKRIAQDRKLSSNELNREGVLRSLPGLHPALSVVVPNTGEETPPTPRVAQAPAPAPAPSPEPSIPKLAPSVDERSTVPSPPPEPSPEKPSPSPPDSSKEPAPVPSFLADSARVPQPSSEQLKRRPDPTPSGAVIPQPKDDDEEREQERDPDPPPQPDPKPAPPSVRDRLLVWLWTHALGSRKRIVGGGLIAFGLLLVSVAIATSGHSSGEGPATQETAPVETASAPSPEPTAQPSATNEPPVPPTATASASASATTPDPQPVPHPTKPKFPAPTADNVLAKVNQALSDCMPKLTDEQGSSRAVDVVVDEAGRTQVTLLNGLSDRPYGRCVKNEIEKVRFGASDGYQARYPFVIPAQ